MAKRPGRKPSFVHQLSLLVGLLLLLLIWDYDFSFPKNPEPQKVLAQEQPRKTAIWLFAHPDDEVLNAGIALLRHKQEGFHNVIVTVTSGDKVPEGPHMGLSPGFIMEAREKEERAALALLGIDSSQIIFLRKLDQDITVPLIEEEIVKLIKQTPGELYFRGHSPYDRYGEYAEAHPDHTIIGEALLASWQKGLIKNLLFFRMGHLYGSVLVGQCPELTDQERALKQQMRHEYTLVDIAKGRYGLGGLNAAGPFEKTAYQPECFELPQ